MQKAMKEAKREGLKEPLHVDDLVLMAELEEEAVEKFSAWKRTMERRGLRVTMEKTKVVISGKELIRMESGRYDIHLGAVEEGWERIQCGVQDMNGGVIRDVRVSEMCVEWVSASFISPVFEETRKRWL